MLVFRSQWKSLVAEALNRLSNTRELEDVRFTSDSIVAEIPPRPEMGDIAFPMFPFARHFKESPRAVAEGVRDILEQTVENDGYELVAAGPYLNVKLSRPAVSETVLNSILQQGESYGSADILEGTRTMIEFSCPNTNKPLHLGHLRNNALGESISKILLKCRGQVQKVNLINDRGIHICKSMAAYMRFGEGKTPDSEGMKGDHFVGDYYVRYTAWAEEDSSAEEEARSLLRRWENDDPDVMSLWRKMNGWVISGLNETYDRTGIEFDRIYFESDTYGEGKEEILEGVEKGIFTREADSSVWVDLTEIDLDKKILLRSDGTSVYITQDIGTAIARHRDWAFDRMVYVVGSEQEYHFNVLFHVLKMLGYEWTRNLHHLAYGMVNLSEGKMKSREGTVVDADDLLRRLFDLAKKEITDKGREAEVDDIDYTAERITQAAVNYYVLHVSPLKDMIFDPKESISFNGDTGPYLQYTGARISSILRKFEQMNDKFEAGKFSPALIGEGDEWELVKKLAMFPEMVSQAAEELNPSLLAGFLFDIAKTFSRYYHDNPVLHNESVDLVVTRVTLTKAVLQVLKNGYELILIPFLEKM